MKLQLVAFNRGLIDSRALARAADVPRVALSAETFTNFLPRVLGSMMLRPGTGYIGATNSNNATRLLPFVFSTDDTALLELTGSVMRVWIDDALVTRASVTAAVSNGSFDANLTGWTDNDEGSTPESVWVTGGYMGLTGDGTSAAIRDQQVTVSEASVTHALSIIIERGPATLRVGSSAGDDDYINETDLQTGAHSLAFTPTTDFHIRLQSRLKRQVLVNSCTVEAAGVMTVTTPWVEADLSLLRYDQSADVIFVAAAGNRQQRIERRATESWSVVDYLTDNGPVRTQNVGPLTITASVLTGNGTLTASASLFRSTHVGALFRVDSSLQQVSDDISAEDTFTDPAIRVTGITGARKFDLTATPVGPNKITLQRSFSSEDGPWSDFKTYTSDQDRTVDDGLDNQIVWYRLGIKTGDYVGPATTCYLDYASGSITGYARITGYTSATVVDAEVLSPFGSTTAERDWFEGAWSDERGWPTAVAFDEGRLWWAGQNQIWGSQSDAFDSFEQDTEGDKGPINRSIGSGPVDTINWLVGAKQLLIGAEGAEWEAQSTSFDEPLTPTNFHLHDPSTQGSATVGAVKIDDRVLFLQRGGLRVFELAPDTSGYGYSSSDVSALVPDIGKPGITVMAVQRQPDTRMLAVRSNGTVAMLVYDSVEEVICWLDIETGGAASTIEDVAVLPAKDGEADDQVYFVVKRTLPLVTNIWSEANVLDYGGVLGTDVTASGLTIANFFPPSGTNFCSWQGTSAAGKTHELRITATTSVGDIRVEGHVSSDILLTTTLIEGVESVLTINVPSTGGETGWRVVTNEANIPEGTWACELYDVTDATGRYLEKLALEDDCLGGTQTRLADSHILFTNDPPSATVSGLGHLEGESVVCWADGKCLDDADGDIATFTVSSASITLTDGGSSYSATSGVVGLPYTARFRSGKLLALPTGRSGIGSHKKISGLGLILAHAHPMGLEFGPDFTTMDPMPRVEEGAPIDPDAIRTAYEEDFIAFPGGWSHDERLCLRAAAPRPVYVLAAAFDAAVNK